MLNRDASNLCRLRATAAKQSTTSRKQQFRRPASWPPRDLLVASAPNLPRRPNRPSSPRAARPPPGHAAPPSTPQRVYPTDAGQPRDLLYPTAPPRPTTLRHRRPTVSPSTPPGRIPLRRGLVSDAYHRGDPQRTHGVPRRLLARSPASSEVAQHAIPTLLAAPRWPRRPRA